MILYHQTSVRLIVSICMTGLIAQKPDAWKGLLDGVVADGDLVVWFTDSIRPLGSYLHPSKCLVQVNSSLLDGAKLRELRVSGWWVYTDSVPARVIRLTAWQRYRRREPKFW